MMVEGMKLEQFRGLLILERNVDWVTCRLFQLSLDFRSRGALSHFFQLRGNLEEIYHNSRDKQHLNAGISNT